MECDFLEVYGDRIEGNGHKLEHGKFQLHIRIFFTMRVLKYCSSVPERLWDFHPWSCSRLAGHSLEQPDLIGPDLSRDLC